jgi:hypothetical protein
MAVAIAIGALVVVIGVSWFTRVLVNALFRPAEKAFANRRVNAETERIQQRLQSQRRNPGE